MCHALFADNEAPIFTCPTALSMNVNHGTAVSTVTWSLSASDTVDGDVTTYVVCKDDKMGVQKLHSQLCPREITLCNFKFCMLQVRLEDLAELDMGADALYFFVFHERACDNL